MLPAVQIIISFLHRVIFDMLENFEKELFWEKQYCTYNKAIDACLQKLKTRIRANQSAGSSEIC